MHQEPTPRAVAEFLDSTVLAEDSVWSAVLEASSAAGLPAIAVSPQQGKFLCLLAGAMRARRVLEIGTLGGFSTIWLARGVGPEGRVVTLEYQAKHAEIAQANLRLAGVEDRVEIVVGAALDTLPTISGDPFDLIFIDADKENNIAYLEWAIRLARPGSMILLDNVVRAGKIIDPESEDSRARIVRKTLQVMGGHPRLDTAVLQTVDARDWDGLAFALVR